MLSVKTRESSSATIISLSGRLDGQTCKEADSALQEAITRESGRGVILNMEDLEYMSSVGLRVVLVTAKAARAKSLELAICSPSPMVLEVLEISGFSSILRIFDTEAEAEGALVG